jgi:hypothetical protein
MEVDSKDLENIINILTDETSVYGIRRKLEYEQRAYNAKHYLRVLIDGVECDCALHEMWKETYDS